jgi:hypothetical protein
MAKKKSKKQDWEIIDDVSTMGYRDDSPYRNMESIDIYTPNGLIDMSETGMPILANGRYLPPYSGMHQFEPGVVREKRIMQTGGDIDPEMLYRNKYNTTLNKRQTKKFNKWVEQESVAQKRDILMDLGAYDVQGFYKSGDYKNRDNDGHGTDTYKKPNHPTFSNQSKYHGADGFYGGEWKPDGAYQPSKQTLELYGEDYLRDQFLKEPNRPEHLDLSRFKSGENTPIPFVYKTGGYIPIMQSGGRAPLKISDPREFKRREQAYNDSLNLFLSSEKQKEALRSSGYNPLGNTPWSGGIASHPTIKPVQEEAWGKNGITSTWIDVYEKPVQPVVYEPRPIQTPIQLDREEGLLESNPINLGDINPIPFESGSYFTRKRKPQEADRGKMEYFDKKTGRSIGLYDDGGELPEAGSGYKVVRSSERKGKTHKVTGPDGTVKFFGDSKLGQHPKDPARKAAFYARHKKNLAGNPYFRAFARKTWEEGGELNEWEILDAAQDGKFLKDDDSTLENIVEFVDPTGLLSWDDVKRSYQNTGFSPQTGLEFLGALPLLGKIGKSGKVIAGGTDLLHTLAPIMKNPKAQKVLYDTYRTYKNVGGDKLDKALGYTTQLLVDNTKLFNPTYRASSDAAINTINKIEKAARLSKAKDFIPTSEYKPYSDYQQPIVPIDNTRVATPIIPIKTEKSYIQKAPLPGQSVPTMDFAFGGNLILEKYQDGGSNWEIVSDNEWEII